MEDLDFTCWLVNMGKRQLTALSASGKCFRKCLRGCLQMCLPMDCDSMSSGRRRPGALGSGQPRARCSRPLTLDHDHVDIDGADGWLRQAFSLLQDG